MPPISQPPFGANATNHTNGKVETLPHSGGVSSIRPPVRRAPTVFPADVPVQGLAPLLYVLTRFELGGFPPLRLLTGLWLVLAAVGFTGVVPAGPVWVVLGIGLVAAQFWTVRRERQRDFVRFTPLPAPSVTPTPLPATDKFPVHVSGLLHVEGKYARFTYLPGFYRTFATGEHALLCQARDRSAYAVLRIPLEEIGMWYAFVSPDAVKRLEWGEVRFGATTGSGIAVTYQLELPAGPRRRRAKLVQETLVIAAAPDDAQRIFADLRHRLPATAISAPG